MTGLELVIPSSRVKNSTSNRIKWGLIALVWSTFALLAPALHSDPLTFHVAGTYIAPNEEYPGRLAPTLTSSPPGAYIAVGTERGFIGAALTPAASHLILADMDPNVTLYNRINILLLKIAGPHRADYLRLRLQPQLVEWELSAQRVSLSATDVQFLRNHFQTWKTNVVNNYAFRAFHQQPEHLSDKFANANYLYHDGLHARLYKLASEDKITTVELNLADPAASAKLVDEMNAAGIGISVVDISNAWWRVFIPREKLVASLEKFNAIAAPSARLVLTGYSFFGIATSEFQYFVSDFQHIRDEGGILKFFKHLSWHGNWRSGGFTYFNNHMVTSRTDCDGLLGGAKPKVVLHRGIF